MKNNTKYMVIIEIKKRLLLVRTTVFKKISIYDYESNISGSDISAASSY